MIMAPFFGVHTKGDIDTDIDIDKVHNMGGCQNYGPILC